jgi:hypothetical protein
MTDTEKRKRGIIRVSVHSIIKAIYGSDVGYEAISMKIDRDDRSMLEITVSHPTLPDWRPGKKIHRIEMDRGHEQTQE